MSLSTRMLAEPLRSLAFGAITGAYAPIGTALSHPERIIKLYNGTDADMLISFDGVNDNDILPSKGFVLLDVCANKTRDDGFYLGQDTVVWARQEAGAPTVGSVYLTVFYGANVSI
jgi:hypothetical protein